MNIVLGQPYSYSEIGKKKNNEDYVYPPKDKVSVDDRLFVLCDGVGGQERGEVASKTVCEALGYYFKQNVSSEINSSEQAKDLFLKALAFAYEEIDKKDKPEDIQKMATTLTLSYFYGSSCLVAHIGDSRVYHVRPNKGILFQTTDHSLVNDLIKVGELTVESAKTYPHRNVITRAVQPHQEHPTKADISIINDLQAGDYIFMCSDGVLEHIDNEKLLSILSSTETDEEKVQTIKKLCLTSETRDNNTCFLIPIKENKTEDKEKTIPNKVPIRKKKKKQKKTKRKFIIVILLLIIVCICYAFYNHKKELKKEWHRIEMIKIR